VWLGLEGCAAGFRVAYYGISGALHRKKKGEEKTQIEEEGRSAVVIVGGPCQCVQTLGASSGGAGFGSRKESLGVRTRLTLSVKK